MVEASSLEVSPQAERASIAGIVARATTDRA
jgi:hypothetical protein